MFENIGWLMYVFTRLDAIRDLLCILIVLSIVAVYLSGICYLLEERKSDIARTGSKWVKRGGVCAIICTCLFTAIPTKRDALLIYGVTIGVSAAEKATETINKSELVGKVVQIC